MKEKLNHVLTNVSLRQLRALAALIRAGSTKGAAAALHVTPPAITLQLRQLEERIGMPLLERGPAGPVATEVGREILGAIRRIEAELSDCAEAIEALRGLDGGHVAIGVISTAKYFAPRVIAAFKKAHAGIDMRLVIGNRQEMIAGLATFDFDLAVMGRPPQDIEVEQAVIGDHPHVIIAPADHPLCRQRHIGLTALADENFLLRENGSGSRLLAEDLFAKAGLSPTIGMEIGSNETIKQAVMAGLGIALISAHTVAAEIENRRLAVLDVAGLPIVRQWFVVKHRAKRLSPAAARLWTFFSGAAKTFLPDWRP